MCNKEKFWSTLCDAIARPQWKEDARFRSFKERLAHREHLTELIDEALSSQTTKQWLDKLSGRIPVAPVNDIAQALENPFVTEHGRLQTLTHPTKGDYRLVANPVHASAGESPSNPAPRLGEHTESLLKDLGYSKTRIQGLRSDGII
jgi:crotonobetainyl-CoA:carnitine CoA-transferase CaiB-like acyl-CoA transferase